MDEFNNVTDQEWAFEIWGEPVADFALSNPNPGRAGEVNELSVNGATPGAALVLAAGLADGVTDIPTCPGLQVQVANAIVGDTARANANGNAVFRGFVPAVAQGRAVFFHAFSPSVCTLSNRIQWVFE